MNTLQSTTSAANLSTFGPGGFSIKIAAVGYYEVPFEFVRGAIQGIWSAATGEGACVTELF